MDAQQTNQTSSAQTRDLPVKTTWKQRFKRNFRMFVFAMILLLGFLVYWFYFNVYSNGERKGTLIKITHKGNVFKTDEGEMWLSCRNTINAEKFFFSVTNDSIATCRMNVCSLPMCSTGPYCPGGVTANIS
jgi:hypothetical protein